MALVSAAENRQTFTYEALGKRFKVPAVSVGNHLAHIHDYCQQNKLPPLTCLVVGKDSGVPSGGFKAASDIGKAREAVYQFDWFSVVPPTAEELAQVSSGEPAEIA